MKEKEIHIGTKPLNLVIAYSAIWEKIPEMQDPEERIGIKRGNYTPEEAYELDRVWTNDEINIALKEAAKELVKRGIIPTTVRPFVDDRFGELSREQMERFKKYCTEITP